MPLLLDKKQPDEAYLKQLTDLPGIRDRLTHLPHELSGGQQQRSAIARTLIAKPDIIFADEPTGNLDSKSGGEVMGMLENIWKKMGKTLVVITHDSRILQSMRIEQAAGLNGNRYAAFHQLNKEQAQKLHENTRLYDVGDTIFIGRTPLANSSLSLYLWEYHDNALSMYPAISNIKEGRLPEKANEIALSEDTLQYLELGAAVGDTVSLDLRTYVMDGSLPELEYSADFVLALLSLLPYRVLPDCSMPAVRFRIYISAIMQLQMSSREL